MADYGKPVLGRESDDNRTRLINLLNEIHYQSAGILKEYAREAIGLINTLIPGFMPPPPEPQRSQPQDNAALNQLLNEIKELKAQTAAMQAQALANNVKSKLKNASSEEN